MSDFSIFLAKGMKQEQGKKLCLGARSVHEKTQYLPQRTKNNLRNEEAKKEEPDNISKIRQLSSKVSNIQDQK